MVATRRWLLSGMILVGLGGLALPRPTHRPPAVPAAAAAYPRYAQATSPLDHWQRGTAPVLVADQPWEQGAVYEPTVLYDAARRRYQMWYTGGWERAAIGSATSSDGIRWHKHRGPVLGLGAGGFAASAARNDVIRVAGTYYLFFAGDDDDHALHAATSPDGVHWRTHPRAVLTPTRDALHLANTAVWVEGGTWHMLYEAWTPAGIWEMGLATGRGPFRWQRVAGAFPLRSLQVGAGAYGGPAISGHAGHYDLYYHAAHAGNLPTDVYHATSADLLHWHLQAPGAVLPRALGWEVDQTADPFVAGGPRGRLLYYAGMDNPRRIGRIGLSRTS